MIQILKNTMVLSIRDNENLLHVTVTGYTLFSTILKGFIEPDHMYQLNEICCNRIFPQEWFKQFGVYFSHVT